MNSNKIITVKLLIDTKANKVLFAEASKDFVDFLFFLLSLPIGTALKLLDGKYKAASIVNIYNSFANLDQSYLQPNLDKSVLLDPKPSISVSNVPLLMGTSADRSSTTRLYSCSNCCKTTTNKCKVASCTNCKMGTMTKETEYFASPSSDASSSNAAGYVQGVISYMISDDLKVTPMSVISSILMMSKFNVTNFSVLQERNVQIGIDKGLELLNASFQSTTVLTDVFLGSKTTKTR